MPSFDADQYARELHKPPPHGKPYAVPLPGTAKDDRSAVYRHYRFADKPLLSTLDPAVLTAHDSFEASVKKGPNKRCLGSRAWIPATKTFSNFDWISYAQTAERRKNFGAGLVQLHKEAGVTQTRQYGVGLWCQNRAEWQITGACAGEYICKDARSAMGELC